MRSPAVWWCHFKQQPGAPEVCDNSEHECVECAAQKVDSDRLHQASA